MLTDPNVPEADDSSPIHSLFPFRLVVSNSLNRHARGCAPAARAPVLKVVTHRASEQFFGHDSETRSVAASAELLSPHTQLRLVIQTAIWLRLGKSSLVRMCCTWFCAVRSER